MAARTKFEYISFRTQNCAEVGNDNMLNALGAEGWELINLWQAPDQDLKISQVPQMDYYFKRELIEDAGVSA